MIAFTEKEKTVIRSALKAQARKCAASQGVRKTTVSELAQAADISVGAFYNFYASKELLFFEVLEDLHEEIMSAANAALTENASLPDAERAAKAVLAACRALDESGMMGFMERDVHHILRKIPTEVQDAHYHSDEKHIRDLLQAANLNPKGGMALAAAAIRGLMLTVSHREDIGTLYPQVLETLVRGACNELFPEP